MFPDQHSQQQPSGTPSRNTALRDNVPRINTPRKNVPKTKFLRKMILRKICSQGKRFPETAAAIVVMS